MLKKTLMFIGLLAALAGCGGETETSTTTGTGAAGGSGGAATTAGGTGGVGGTSSSTTGGTAGAGGEAPLACYDTAPAGCETPDPLLAYDPTGDVQGAFLPILPWEKAGGSISCFGPFDNFTVGHVSVGFATATLPDFLPIDVWTEPAEVVGEVPPAHTFAWVEFPRIDETPGEGSLSSLTFGIFAVPPVVAAKKMVCVSIPLAAYAPIAISPGACEVPSQTRWLGLPWTDTNGDGVSSTDELKVALLACPLDTTGDDGTPAVNPYSNTFAYGILP